MGAVPIPKLVGNRKGVPKLFGKNVLLHRHDLTSH